MLDRNNSCYTFPLQQTLGFTDSDMNYLRSFIAFLLLSIVSGALMAAEETLIAKNGSAIKLLYFEPKLRPVSPRLAVLISGGTSNTFMARAQFWLGKELIERGWSIAVPIAPDRSGFTGANALLIPDLVTLLQVRHGLGSSKPLLVGISSGGSAALAIAVQNPESYGGVVATPGRLLDELNLKPLHGLPIYLRIGENDDFRWNRHLAVMEKKLRDAGGNVDAAIVVDAKHIFQLEWDNLENWLNGLQQPSKSAGLH